VIDEHDAAWKAWFASSGVRPHRVSYEDLAADMVGVTRGILDFLGLDEPDERVIAPRHERQADELSGRWIERYRRESVRRWFRGSGDNPPGWSPQLQYSAPWFALNRRLGAFGASEQNLVDQFYSAGLIPAKVDISGYITT
jgi:Stf0 sulphotransferase